MPRPRKWRNVCCLPSCSRFGPLDAQELRDHAITMTVDEYETVRLIDLEGCTQETCADQMGIARTTVQRIYNDARHKLARALVEGLILTIEGGDYRLCGGPGGNCRCSSCQHCQRGICEQEKE